MSASASFRSAAEQGDNDDDRDLGRHQNWFAFNRPPCDVCGGCLCEPFLTLEGVPDEFIEKREREIAREADEHEVACEAVRHPGRCHCD